MKFEKFPDEKFQQIFMHVIGQSRRDNTYKFAFARFLLEYAENETESSIDFEKIANNPNFVFTPDASFDIKVLYDLDGNVINVNSWLECANYVNGGWFSEIIDLDLCKRGTI